MTRLRYTFTFGTQTTPPYELLPHQAGEAARAEFRLTYGEWAYLKDAKKITRKTEIHHPTTRTWDVVPIPAPRLHSFSSL